MSAAAPASAEARGCDGVRIVEAPGLAPDWVDAVRATRVWLSTAPGLGCGVADVHAAPLADTSVHLHVESSDGRTADRIVRKPSALAATVAGLVASIPDEPVEPLAPLSEPVRPAPSPPPDADQARPPLRAPVGLWVGAGMGARASEPALFGMLDFEGRIDVSVREWLLVGSLRYSVSLPSGYSGTYSEADLGLGLGRRWELGKTAIDLSFIPSVAASRFTDSDEKGFQGTVVQFRVGASARWSVPLSSSWRLTLTLDTDLAPQDAVHPVRVEHEAPPLPAWTSGFRLGASGQLL
jgi:hypothetical protein